MEDTATGSGLVQLEGDEEAVLCRDVGERLKQDIALSEGEGGKLFRRCPWRANLKLVNFRPARLKSGCVASISASWSRRA